MGTTANILLLHSSIDGQTRRICERLRELLTGAGHTVSLHAIDAEPESSPLAFDAVVIGASIRYGHHRPAVTDYITRHQAALESRPNAFFSVNIVARKPGKRTPETNPYLKKFLRRIAWRPQMTEVFAGRLDYPKYGVFDRTVIRLIMWMTKGPTAPDTVIEYTDWGQVERFAGRIGEMVDHRPG